MYNAIILLFVYIGIFTLFAVRHTMRIEKIERLQKVQWQVIATTYKGLFGANAWREIKDSLKKQGIKL